MGREGRAEQVEMPSEDRHINFALMRQYVLDQQDSRGNENIGSARSGKAHPGKDYWRSLEELADTPAFREFVQREYPQHAEEWDDPIERRTFLKLMGASLALAGLSGCVYQPPEKIVPYVRQPEEEVPGKALYFATASTLGGIATPLLAKSTEGRPTKLEGNPDHPNSHNGNANDLGSSATDIFSQASVLTLYDPDRSQTTLYRDESRPWSTFVGEIRTALDEQRPKQGAGLRFLTETITSPTLAAQLKAILTEFPQARWHQYEPANNDNARAGAVMAFGQPVNTIYNFDKADRILSLDADFLSCQPGMLKYARDFAAHRRITEGRKEMSRLYVVESTPTTTGASADHRWTVRPSEMEAFVRTLLVKLTPDVRSTVQTSPITPILPSSDISEKWLNALAADLVLHREASIVIVGDEQPPHVHALAHLINGMLLNVGKTVTYTDPIDANSADQTASLRDLVQDMDAGRVDLLVMLGGNPVYNTPADLKLDKDRMSKVKVRVHLSLYSDETSELCHWHVPETHYLEAWSDTRSYDGTVTIVQPLIEPLYQNKSAHELLAVCSSQYDRKPYDIIRDYWQGARREGAGGSQQAAGAGEQTTGGSRQRAERGQTTSFGQQASSAVPASTPSSDFEMWWRKCVHDGFIPNTALATKSVALNSDLANQLNGTQQPAPDTQYEIVFRTDPTIYDGRFANNGWLQELPKPLTKLTWDNAALLSPNTAKTLGIENAIGRKGGDIYVDTLKINYRGLNLSDPVPTWITPGQPDNVITIHLGYGRKRAGRVGNEHGFSAYDIRTSDSPWFATGAQVEKAGSQYQLAVTQLHFMMEGRDILRSTTLEEYLQGTHEAGEEREPSRGETLYQPELFDYKNQGNESNYAWGMAIDLNNCVGCNACTIACQSENNIPIVGKEQIVRSREMHWIRVDTYFKGDDANNPEGTHFMPVPCMHCENAPCEPVCPVHATVHSAEGINDMVYNRCVGTRYCSNNCPYKVRRFNFLLYQDWDTPTYQLMRNPDVSVRSRGVMEKCTYCIQRIQGAKIQSEIEGRKVRDGEIVTACQAVCPTEAIVFGDINDPNSRVSRVKAEQRNYSLLAELNTRPRTTYLSALRNPNPEIRGD